MKKFMLALGLLLAVGLLFADAPTPNWMQQVEGRYFCSFQYSDDLYWIARGMADDEDLSSEQCNLQRMDSDLYYYTQPLSMVGSLEEMYFAAGCEPDGVINPVAEFRAGLISYNGMAADFRALFNQCVRSYLQEGGDRAELVASLNIARGGYSQCLTGGENICNLPEEPSDEE